MYPVPRRILKIDLCANYTDFFARFRHKVRFLKRRTANRAMAAHGAAALGESAPGEGTPVLEPSAEPALAVRIGDDDQAILLAGNI